MSIQQHKRQSDLEKRLQLLRKQVYGKSSENQITPKGRDQIKKSANQIYQYTNIPSSPESLRSDLTYLNQDLLKILTFSSLAIGAQIILLFLLKNQILRLNLF